MWSNAVCIQTFWHQHLFFPEQYVANIAKYINDKYGKEIDKRSSEKGKQTQIAKRDDLLKFFSPANKANLKLIFDLQNAIVDGKLKLINKFELQSDINRP